jgi:uncharacterized protein (TIGR00297 family)
LTPVGLLLGLVLSAAIGVFGYWRGSLSRGGILGAIVVGTLVFALGGLTWALLLVAFFATSSALSHYRERAKEPLSEKFQKGQRRDLAQVLANGGWGALLALAFGLDPHPLYFIAFAGAMAAVNADTWATELGVLAKSAPRSIATGRVVAVGTSGGVTVFGTSVAFLGALTIGALAFVLVVSAGSVPVPFLLPLLLGVAGLLGSLVDSLLGATVQAIYYCDYDQKETESATHRCGRRTRLIRGWRWLDNDGVNFLTSVTGSALATLLYVVTARPS